MMEIRYRGLKLAEAELEARSDWLKAQFCSAARVTVRMKQRGMAQESPITSLQDSEEGGCYSGGTW